MKTTVLRITRASSLIAKNQVYKFFYNNTEIEKFNFFIKKRISISNDTKIEIEDFYQIKSKNSIVEILNLHLMDAEENTRFDIRIENYKEKYQNI